jgi:hypothetical protein
MPAGSGANELTWREAPIAVGTLSCKDFLGAGLPLDFDASSGPSAFRLRTFSSASR